MEPRDRPHWQLKEYEDGKKRDPVLPVVPIIPEPTGHELRNREYILQLEEKNRRSKQLEKQMQSKDKKIKSARERGFEVYIRGANQDRLKKREGRSKDAPKSKVPMEFPVGHRYSSPTEQDSSSAPSSRKTWNRCDGRGAFAYACRKLFSGGTDSALDGTEIPLDCSIETVINVRESASMEVEGVDEDQGEESDYSDDSFESISSENERQSPDKNDVRSPSRKLARLLRAAGQDQLSILRQSLEVSVMDSLTAAPSVSEKTTPQAIPPVEEIVEEEDLEEYGTANSVEIPSLKLDPEPAEFEAKPGPILRVATARTATSKQRGLTQSRPSSAVVGTREFSTPRKNKKKHKPRMILTGRRQPVENREEKKVTEAVAEPVVAEKEQEEAKSAQSPKKSPVVAEKEQEEAKSAQSPKKSPVVVEKEAKLQKTSSEEPPPDALPASPRPSLLRKVTSLNPTQQRFLLQMLDQLVLSPKHEEEEVAAMKHVWKSLDRGLRTLEKLGDSPKESQLREEQKAEPHEDLTGKGKELVLRLQSSWSRSNVVGLTGIELVAADGTAISVPPSTVQLVPSTAMPISAVESMLSELPRLFNGKNAASLEKDMWLGCLPENGGHLDIAIRLPDSFELSKLQIWNYNKNVHLSSLGVKDAELFWREPSGAESKGGGVCVALRSLFSAVPIWMDRSASKGRLLWKGVIAKGSGNKSLDSCTVISIGAPITAKAVEEEKVEGEESSGRPIWLASSSVKPVSSVLESPPKPAVSVRKRWRRDENSPEPVFAGVEPATSKSVLRKRSRRRPNNLQQSWDSLERFNKVSRSRLSVSVGQDDVILGKDAPMTAEVEKTEPRAKVVQEEDVSKPIRIDESFDRAPTAFKRRATEETELATTEEIDSPHLPSKLVDHLSGSDAPSAEKPLISVEVEEPPRLPVFAVPVLPKGKLVEFSFWSTWGDPHYIGLNGIELFDSDGELVKVSEVGHICISSLIRCQVVADPADINVLPECSGDPRTAKNLIDGVYATSDDLHMWLAPVRHSKHDDEALATVSLELERDATISMIRVWNYNKSRVHSHRGVRWVSITLDGRPIFAGEVRRGIGQNSLENSGAEVILFTEDQSILDCIRKYDTEGANPEDVTSALVAEAVQKLAMDRPKTAECADGEKVKSVLWRKTLLDVGEPSPVLEYSEERPTTGKASPDPRTVLDRLAEATEHAIGSEPKHPLATMNIEPPTASLHPGRRIDIQICSSWGDENFFGLTGIQVLVGPNREQFPLQRMHLHADPLDVNIGEHRGDPRTLSKLVDGVNVTTDDVHMWLAPLRQGSKSRGAPWLQIDLQARMQLWGLRVWNYNKSEDDSVRGVRFIRLFVDGKQIGDLIELRPAPGTACFDCRQDICFSDVAGSDSNAVVIRRGGLGMSYISPPVRQDFETPLFPKGFTLKFCIENSWDDPYYVGLDALHIYDHRDRRYALLPHQIHAFPGSVSELPGSEQDGRIADNLCGDWNAVEKGTDSQYDPWKSWLAPLAHSLNPGEPNVLYVVFDKPVSISMIKVECIESFSHALQFWNYSKTPSRGVRDFHVWLDGDLIYSGTLAPVAGRNTPSSPPGSETARLRQKREKIRSLDDPGQVLLFTNDPRVILREKHRIHYCGEYHQDVLCIDEGRVMVQASTMYSASPIPNAVGITPDISRRPKTGVPPPRLPQQRPRR